MCSLFANTCHTCEDTNEDECDLDDLFEDAYENDGQVYWSLKLREKAFYIYSSYFSSSLFKCHLYCIFSFLHI